jgi:uncharacterized flavoprotein (TIGR03862 family)
MPTTSPTLRHVAIIGGGPAGLMAAECIQRDGIAVTVYDSMPTVGRKFLLAGVGGMNITHAEPTPAFLSRYGDDSGDLTAILQDFDATALREWIHGLGIETFVGSTGRVFPTAMKAAPLLRSWLHRLRASGVSFAMRHRWLGWQENALLFATPEGERHIQADAVVLALGGASWARLGSDGHWVPLLCEKRVNVAPLRAANCGFEIDWSTHFQTRFAGHALKSVSALMFSADGTPQHRLGELMITEHGIEGSLVYALSRTLREQIEKQGTATLTLDLAPGRDLARLIREIDHPRGARSMGSHLQSRAGITGVKAGLLREIVPTADFQHPARLAAAIKALPLTLRATRPIDEAISSAGGVRFAGLDAQLMLHELPGVFCAGEMLDWEAPTGGYLLSACFATGRAAGLGVVQWLNSPQHRLHIEQKQQQQIQQ